MKRKMSRSAFAAFAAIWILALLMGFASRATNADQANKGAEAVETHHSDDRNHDARDRQCR